MEIVSCLTDRTDPAWAMQVATLSAQITGPCSPRARRTISPSSRASTGQRRLLADLQPWSNGGALVTFLAGPQVTPVDIRAAYHPRDYNRLAELKTRWDPTNMFRFNKNIAPNPREA
jgi:hypothetical protein